MLNLGSHLGFGIDLSLSFIQHAAFIEFLLSAGALPNKQPSGLQLRTFLTPVSPATAQTTLSSPRSNLST
jgi:hypothetical protein